MIDYKKDPIGMAVEIFIALIQDHKSKSLEDDILVMRLSIDLVKQAQEGFK